MRVRRAISDYDGIYFITFTCARWIHLFEEADGYDLVYEWFDLLKNKGHFITGYVIMPNHLHALLAFRNTKGQSINSIIGNGKRFIAYDLVNNLKNRSKNERLDQLSSFVNQTDRKREKLHEVFEPSFDWKECTGNKFIEQKLNYMHENPCRGKWSLAIEPAMYRHSSAKYYLTGVQGEYPVTNYTDLEDIDLTIPG